MSRSTMKSSLVRLFAYPPVCSKLGISWCHQIATPTPDHDHQQQEAQNDVSKKKKKKKKKKEREIVEIEGEDEIRPVFEKIGIWDIVRENLSGERGYPKKRNLVLWDMDTAPLPKPEYAPHIWRNIACWIYSKWYFGPIELRGYGDKYKMRSVVWDQLLKGRGTFTHVPSEGGDATSFCHILTDLAVSTVDCPPTNNMIISGDERLKGFGSSYLHESRYHTVAIHPSNSVGKVYADQIWIWEDVAAGGSAVQLYLKGI